MASNLTSFLSLFYRSLLLLMAGKENLVSTTPLPPPANRDTVDGEEDVWLRGLRVPECFIQISS